MLKEKLASEFYGKKILILGFGREGKATYEFLKNNNIDCQIAIADVNSNISELDGIDVFAGENYIEAIYKKYDIVVKSPGISYKQIDISRVTAKITSQTELLLKHGKDKIIGITGTKGKSTTATLLYNMLSKKYKTKLIGNIGVAPFTVAEEWEDIDYFVYELSCHQLENVSFSPRIAVFLNIFEEHLDHYNSYEQYIEAKRNIFKHQGATDILLYNSFFGAKIISHNIINSILIPMESEDLFNIYERNSEIREAATINTECHASINGRTLDIGLGDIHRNIKIPMSVKGLIGVHNLYNAMAAIVVALYLGVKEKNIFSALEEFKGLDHRLQYIGTYNGVDYIDDSISTIPEATINGISSLSNVQTVIIGGMDRGIDYSSLYNYLVKVKIKNIVLMYETGKQIFKAIQEIDNNNNVVYVENLEEAVKVAINCTPKGSVCLLSPAAASYGYFKNFEDRGDKFKEYIINYTK